MLLAYCDHSTDTVKFPHISCYSELTAVSCACEYLLFNDKFTYFNVMYQKISTLYKRNGVCKSPFPSAGTAVSIFNDLE